VNASTTTAYIESQSTVPTCLFLNHLLPVVVVVVMSSTQSGLVRMLHVKEDWFHSRHLGHLRW